MAGPCLLYVLYDLEKAQHTLTFSQNMSELHAVFTLCFHQIVMFCFTVHANTKLLFVLGDRTDACPWFRSLNVLRFWSDLHHITDYNLIQVSSLWIFKAHVSYSCCVLLRGFLGSNSKYPSHSYIIISLIIYFNKTSAGWFFLNHSHSPYLCIICEANQIALEPRRQGGL